MLVPELIQEWPDEELIEDWPELAPLFDFPDFAWRDELKTWPPKFREAWAARAAELEDSGVPWREAEQKAHAETLEVLRRPRKKADVVREPVAAPPIPRRKPRKAVRESLPTMFDHMDDGSSSTYQAGEA